MVHRPTAAHGCVREQMSYCLMSCEVFQVASDLIVEAPSILVASGGHAVDVLEETQDIWLVIVEAHRWLRDGVVTDFRIVFGRCALADVLTHPVGKGMQFAYV